MKLLERIFRENIKYSQIHIKSIQVHTKSHHKSLFSKFSISQYIVIGFQQKVTRLTKGRSEQDHDQNICPPGTWLSVLSIL